MKYIFFFFFFISFFHFNHKLVLRYVLYSREEINKFNCTLRAAVRFYVYKKQVPRLDTLPSYRLYNEITDYARLCPLLLRKFNLHATYNVHICLIETNSLVESLIFFFMIVKQISHPKNFNTFIKCLIDEFLVFYFPI